MNKIYNILLIMSYKISKNFTYEEMYASPTAKARLIDNTPNDEVKSNLYKLVTTILQPIRDEFGEPIIVTSGYRCPKLNTAIGGAINSMHKQGKAADIKAKNMKKLQDCVLEWAKTNNFDQIIIEKPINGVASWLHIGSYYSDNRQRKQILVYDGKYYRKYK